MSTAQSKGTAEAQTKDAEAYYTGTRTTVESHDSPKDAGSRSSQLNCKDLTSLGSCRHLPAPNSNLSQEHMWHRDVVLTVNLLEQVR